MSEGRIMICHIKRQLLLILAALIFAPCLSAFAADERSIITDEQVCRSAQSAFLWHEKNADIEQTGGSSADWHMLTACALGLDEDFSEYAAKAKRELEKRLEAEQEYYLTELARTAAAVYFIGGEPTDLSAADYSSAGDNELVWYIISQKMNGFEYGGCLELLCSRQNGGGFGFGGQTDPDITAMALNALEKDSGEAAAAVDYLSGYYMENYENMSTETAAQLITGLCLQGINPSQSADFTAKNGVRPVDILFSRQTADGGFSHLDGEQANVISTEQALTAICALGRFSADGEGLFSPVNKTTDISVLQNIVGEGFDDYDKSELSSIEGRAVDLKRLERLKERAEAYPPDSETADMLGKKLSESKSRAEDIKRLNSRISGGFYPPGEVGITRLNELKEINREISAVDKADRGLLLCSEELSERERTLERRLAVTAAAAATLIIAAVIYIIKRKGKAKNG